MTDAIAPKLQFRFEGKRQLTLKSRGVDGMCFAGQRNSFDFETAAVRMKPDIPGVIVKGVSVKRQVRNLATLFEHPLRGNPIIGIGSYPTDLRAKMLALNIMNKAIDYQDRSSSRRMSRRDYPLWHKVFGGFRDDLLDAKEMESPSMLIISNVCNTSTAMKIEKVRDILEKYTRIPRVVVVSGCDPMHFFAMKLHIPMDYGFYLGPENRESTIPSVLDL